MFTIKPLQASLLITSFIMLGVDTKHPFVDFNVSITSKIKAFTKHSNVFPEPL